MVILKGNNNIRNQFKKSLFLLLILTSPFAAARVHEFETTHLKSMAGTGVAGVLAEEAAFLNPASLAFFNNLTVYAQRDQLTVKNNRGEIVQKPKAMGFVLADGNPSLSGSLSYTDQEEGSFERKRWAFSTSAPLSEQSAFGTSIRKSKDTDKLTNKVVDYYQTVAGITHALDPKTSLGIVAYDVFNSKGDETKALIGIQHILLDYVTGAIDVGADYTASEISDTLLYRGALQVKVLDDFYLRFGAFRDKLKEEKGNGMGLGWVSPRIAVEFAVKNSTIMASQKYLRNEFKNRETSFAASLRF